MDFRHRRPAVGLNRVILPNLSLERGRAALPARMGRKSAVAMMTVIGGLAAALPAASAPTGETANGPDRGIVRPNCSLPKKVVVRPNCSLPKKAVVRPNCSLPTNAVVRPNCDLPKNAVVRPNCSLPKRP